MLLQFIHYGLSSDFFQFVLIHEGVDILGILALLFRCYRLAKLLLLLHKFIDVASVEEFSFVALVHQSFENGFVYVFIINYTHVVVLEELEDHP